MDIFVLFYFSWAFSMPNFKNFPGICYKKGQVHQTSVIVVIVRLRVHIIFTSLDGAQEISSQDRQAEWNHVDRMNEGVQVKTKKKKTPEQK